MAIEICSCEGLDPKCKKCFGSGYVNSGVSKETPINKKEKKDVQKSAVRPVSLLLQKVESLSRTEVENIQVAIVASLDLKSKKQMQILNAIPFSTTTFRRDLKDKFESLGMLENEKHHLREELRTVTQEIIAKKYSNNLKFKHFLSDKDIDVTSNRQLKDLIREYKKLKAGS